MSTPTPATARLTYDCPKLRSGIHTVTMANEPRLVPEHGPLGQIIYFRWVCEACGEMHITELADLLRGE